MKNSTVGVIVGAVIVVLVIVGVLSYQKNDQTTQSNTSGSLYVGVTDASADISNVSDIDMSVKKVEIHSATKGWVTVSSSEKTYALLTLKASGNTQLYAKNDNVGAGTYDKIRVTLGDTVVHTKTKGDIEAVKPTSEIVMSTSINVRNNEDANLKLDFLADKSLHATSDGKYVFAPVIQSEARSNADISVMSDDHMNVLGGTVDSTTKVGVDLTGASRRDFELSTDTGLKINSNMGGEIKFTLGGKSYSSDDKDEREDEVNTDGSLKVDDGLDTNINLSY